MSHPFYPNTIMNNPTERTITVAAFLTLITLFFVAGCKKGDAGGKPADVDYYTCTMHPSVKSQDPKAKCPICSMDLVPVMKKGAAPGSRPADVDYYTCTMHPSVKSQDAKAKCPICSMDLVPVIKKGAAPAAEPGDVDYYTCTMHPSVRSQDPKGKCPICGMQLVHVMRKGATLAHDHTVVPGTDTNAPTAFTVPVERQQQIGV